MGGEVEIIAVFACFASKYKNRWLTYLSITGIQKIFWGYDLELAWPIYH
jgi:hypothetical protein